MGLDRSRPWGLPCPLRTNPSAAVPTSTAAVARAVFRRGGPCLLVPEVPASGMAARVGRPHRHQAFAVPVMLRGLSGCGLAPSYDPPHHVLPAGWRGQGPFTVPPPLPSRGRCGARTYDRANGQDARTTINVSNKPRRALKVNAVSYCAAVVTGRRNKAWFSGSFNAASTTETRVIAMATRPKSAGCRMRAKQASSRGQNARDKARTDQQHASKSCPAACHVKTNPHLMSKIPPLAPSAWNPARATYRPTRAPCAGTV